LEQDWRLVDGGLIVVFRSEVFWSLEMILEVEINDLKN